MNAQLLEKLGMTSREVKVYLKLLELGQTSANPLAKRLGENRTSVYSLLQSMEKKGVISETIHKKVKYFSATNPVILINHFSQNADLLKKLLPELLAMTNILSQKPKITFYEGVDGIKQIGEILLEVPGSTRFSFMGANERTIHPEIDRYYREDFLNRRIALGIKYKGIVTGKLPMATNYPPTDSAHLRELKYINPKYFPIKIHIDIFPKNKVALYSYDKNDQMGVVIEHEGFYETMCTVFNLAWIAIDAK